MLRSILITIGSCLLTACCMAYNRAQVAQLLQEQSYTELITLTGATPVDEQDNYLLNAAGYAAYQSNTPEVAADYFNRSIVKDSNNIQALLYLGLISKQRSCTEAIPYFLKLIRIKPNNARYYRYAAECFGELKMPDSSFRYITMAYSVAPNEPAIANSYADALLEKKKFVLADSIVQKALLANGSNAQLLATALKSAYLQKRYKNVLLLADGLILTGNISYTPFFYTLLAALQLKNYERCISTYGLLLAGGHETEQVLYYTAKAYAGMKQYDQSNAMLRQCIKSAMSDNTAAYYTELGENMLEMKKYNGAQLYYDTARYLSGDGMLLYRKALAYDAAKQDKQARKYYTDFLKQPDTKDTALIKYARSRVETSAK